jgi:hypothetical protein
MVENLERGGCLRFSKKFEGKGPGHCFGEIKGNGTKFMVGNFG